jgi:hypothetical protein
LKHAIRARCGSLKGFCVFDARARERARRLSSGGGGARFVLVGLGIFFTTALALDWGQSVKHEIEKKGKMRGLGVKKSVEKRGR